MPYNPKIHHRRSIRLKGYDYSQAGLYFLTLSVENMAHIFGEVSQGKMQLNPLGKIAYEEWERTTLIRDNIKLGAFIIMPNHIHGIIEIKTSRGKNKDNIGKFKSPSQTIGSIIRGYKSTTTRKIRIYLENQNNSTRTGELNSPHPLEPKKTSGAFDRKNELELPSDMKSKEFFGTSSWLGKFDSLLRDLRIWQRNYYDIIIRNEKMHQNISNYIINNPKKWKKDKFNK